MHVVSIRAALSAAASSSSRRAFLGKTTTPFAATVGGSSYRVTSPSSSAVAMMSSSSSTKTTSTTAASGYWNRELSDRQAFDISTPPVRQARIVCIADPKDPNNFPLYELQDENVKVLAIGSTMEELKVDEWDTVLKPNILFVSHPDSRSVLSELLPSENAQKYVEWIHARSAGIDFITSPELSAFPGIVTNAKGLFSSTLAEYTMLACGYFAKDLPRLLRNQRASNWEKYSVKELRGSTLGVIGYGDIGKAAARLAKAYGMKVIALKRRQPSSSSSQKEPNDDDIPEKVYYGQEHIPTIFAESDYVLCSAPLTDATRGMIGKEAFENAGSDTVFINVGRGPIVDEPAMIDALKTNKIKGAGLDVMCEEPLPKESPLWGMSNVLLSPHNMDQTDTFMKEATEFFVEENLPRFVRDLTLLNPVDPKAGY